MNIFTKTSTYIQESMAEMKKVTWPTKKETQQYSILVVALSLIVALYLGALDYIFNIILLSLIHI